MLLKADEKSMPFVGRQPTTALTSRNCRAPHAALSARGVKFVSPPRDSPWGVSAVFVDLYGNPYNLLEPKAR